MSYRFRMAGPKRPTLTLHLAVDPARAADDALGRYAALAARLADPGVELRLETTVLPGVVAATDELRPALAAFVDAAIAELRGATPARRETDLSFAVDPAAVAARSGNLFEVGVRLTLGDSDTVDVPPAPDPVAWARDFEEAFAGFDGADGRLRVLAGADGPWALRWSRTAGVWVEFPSDEAACFTLAPLSTVPMSGTAQVMAYDPATLQPAGESTATFAMVDLDAWGEAFLAALDDLASPAMAEAIARLAPTAYADLVRHRTRLAQALSRRLVPAYAGGVPGDPEAARGELENALLDSLARAYMVSAVVQVPASVHAAGEASAPRFFGTVTARGDACTASASTLAPQDRHLTFMVYAAEPRKAVALPLDATYEIRFVDGGGAQRLELALTSGAPDLPPLHVPVPLRAVPAPPMLMQQTASGTGARDGDAMPALEWDYTVEMGVPGKGAQDHLWVDVAYNLPADAGPARATRGPAGGAAGLFEALAAFHSAWRVLAPHVPRIADEAGTPGPAARQVLATVMGQVASVTDRWLSEAPPLAADSPREGATDELVIRFARAHTESRLDVFARLDASRAGEWPSINEQRPTAAPVALPAGEGPDASGGWFQCSYPFDGRDALTLRWRALDLLSRQSVRSTFRVVRNASLAPELVYRTAPVSFAAPVLLPVVEIGRIGPLRSGASLEEALTQVLLPVSRAGAAVLGERFLNVGISYEYPLPIGARARTVTAPVLLYDAVPLSDGALAGLVAALVQGVNTWHEHTQPPTAGALLLLQITLPGTLQLDRVEITVPPGWW